MDASQLPRTLPDPSDLFSSCRSRASAVRTVDLFAGGGGVACAMKSLGLHTRHVEIDPDACRTLRASGFSEVVEGDVRDLSSWLPSDPVVLLHASPPCPKWSRANQRSERIAVAQDLWPETLQAVQWLQPLLVTVENVKDAPADLWCDDLRREGYFVGSWLLNAMDYGAPQTRRRWIIVASKVRAPKRPAATHGLPGSGLQRYRTLRDILEPVGNRVTYPVGTGRAGSEPDRLDRPCPTIVTAEVKGTRATEGSGWSFHGGPDRLADALYLALGWRRATIRECMRAQTFPEDWPFQGTSDAIYRQIGNAVPVVLAKAMLECALDTL